MRAQTYEKKDYSGGLNTTASVREVAPNEATALQNFDITYPGQLKRRLGQTLVGDTVSSKPITGLGAFVRDTGVDLVRSYDTNLQYLNGSVFTTILNTITTGNMMWLENVQALNRLYFCNQDNVLQYWDRAATTLNTCITTPAGTNPHGNVMVWYKNYMFHLNNVKVGATSYTEDIFWSNLGDPNTYDTTNNHTTVPGDGKLITAVPLGDELILFKERSIQRLSGYGNASWQIATGAASYASVSEEVGCISPRGAVQVGDEVWFIDNQARIRRVLKTDFDAFRHDVLSVKIQATLDGVNKAQLAKAIAYTWNNKVYFEIPNGTDTVNSITFVFDILASKRMTPNAYTYVSEAWTTYTGWSHSCAVTYPTNASIDLYFGDSVNASVYMHSGTSDNGADIAAVFEDAESDYEAPDTYKVYKFGYITGQSTSTNSSIYIDTSIDRLPYYNIGTLTISSNGSKVGPTGSATCGPTGTAICGGEAANELRYTYDGTGQYPLGKRIRHKIRHTGQDQPTINSFSSNYTVRGLR